MKFPISMPDDFYARLMARTGEGGNRSKQIYDDLFLLYSLTDRAKRFVASFLEPEEIALCRAALCGTLIERTIIPHLRAEIAEGLETPNPVLVGKINALGLLELYALAEIVREGKI